MVVDPAPAAGRLIGWLPLLPGAVITGGAVTALSLTARFYLPVSLNKAVGEFGAGGSVFVVLSWLIVLCVAVAIGLTLGAVLAQQPPRAPPGQSGTGAVGAAGRAPAELMSTRPGGCMLEGTGP